MQAVLQKTPLHDRHVALGARMVPFAGWEMPVQYEGVIPEHLAVRKDCGAFDVSHMGEIEVEGPRARELLQSLLANDLDRIGPGQAQYTLLTNERGGIIDDLIVYELDPFRFLLIVNAANKDAAFRWIKDREITGSDVRDVSDQYALIAVQGPKAEEILQSLTAIDLPAINYYWFAHGEIAGCAQGNACPYRSTGVPRAGLPIVLELFGDGVHLQAPALVPLLGLLTQRKRLRHNRPHPRIFGRVKPERGANVDEIYP